MFIKKFWAERDRNIFFPNPFLIGIPAEKKCLTIVTFRLCLNWRKLYEKIRNLYTYVFHEKLLEKINSGKRRFDNQHKFSYFEVYRRKFDVPTKFEVRKKLISFLIDSEYYIYTSTE